MPGGDGASNVLFVVLDTVRKDHLGVYGYDEPTTPTLSAFAEEARVYEQAVAPAPWTLPVHASLFTGLYPSEHGATQETPYLEGATTLAESLGDAGYATACYSSNAWITPYTNLTAGFDRQDNFFQVMPGDVLSGPLASLWRTMNDNDRLRSVADRLVQWGNRIHEHLAAGGGGDSKTPAVIDRTIEFVDDAAANDDPFFAFVNLMDAHLPYHPPEEYADEFAPGVDPADVCQNSKEFNCGARQIDDAEWADIRGLYDAEIRHMDAQLSRLFDHLRETGQWADTTVVVCADHGELHGEHDLYGHEFCIYDPLVNVPLLVKHPDVPAGRDETTTVELVDCYHTVLDATGVAARGEPLARERSLLAEDYRDFADAEGDVAPPLGGTAGHGTAEAPAPGDVGFVEYHQPVVELRQLEAKASAAGIALPQESRYYSRMGAARTPTAKYVHNTRIADEAYRLDRDPGERADLLAGDATGNHVADEGSDAGDDATDGAADDPAIRAARDALFSFLDWVDADWPEEADGDVDDALSHMDGQARDRLRDLGYLD